MASKSQHSHSPFLPFSPTAGFASGVYVNLLPYTNELWLFGHAEGLGFTTSRMVFVFDEEADTVEGRTEGLPVAVSHASVAAYNV